MNGTSSVLIREKHVSIIVAYFKLLDTDKRAKDVAKMKLYEEIGEQFFISARHCGLIIRKGLKDPEIRKEVDQKIMFDEKA